MLYARPSGTVAVSYNSDTGLTGSLGVRVDALDGTNVIPRTTAGIVEVEAGSGVYALAALVTPATAGRYLVLWDEGATVTGSEDLEITSVPTVVLGEHASLITRAEIKLRLGITDSSKDSLIDSVLPAATAAIQAITNRSFEVTPDGALPTERTFHVSESGFATIADANQGSVTAVRAGTRTLSRYRVEPNVEEYPVAWWIEIPRRLRVETGQMGFERGLDVYYRDHGYSADFHPLEEVTVTAVWGWPYVPDDVRQAAVWTAVAFFERPSTYISESIAGYSRVSANPLRDAVPDRATALLDHHFKGGLD